MKILFIDMDNTLAENQTPDNIEFFPGLYLNKRPLKIVIRAIRYLYHDYKFVIVSKAVGGQSGKDEKIEWLNKFFSDTKEIIILNPEDTKSAVINEYMMTNKINSKDCVIIDDNKQILQNCKKLGMTVKYPQQVICDFEEIEDKAIYFYP